MSQFAKGTRRVTDLLDFVAQARTAPSSRHIFERLAAPRSSGYDLLKGLIQRQYLQRRADGDWILGDEVHALAMSRFGIGHIAPQIAPTLCALQEKTQEAVQLIVLDGERARVTHSFSSIRSMSLSPEVGARIAVNWTAAGYLLVSGMEQRSLHRFLIAHARHSPAGRAMATVEPLVCEIRDAQRRGYAIEIEQGAQGVSSIAAPVTDARGTCVAAVSLVVPVSRLAHCQDTLVSLVCAAAAKLTRGLASGK